MDETKLEMDESQAEKLNENNDFIAIYNIKSIYPRYI